MRGQVLEIATGDPDRALRVLKEAQTRGQAPFEEVVLYGVQIHVVVPSADEFRLPIRRMLEAEGVPVTRIDWIVPTLEDVFISTVRASGGRG